MTKTMNLAFGVNFDLLKTNLAAAFEKDDNGSRILLSPTKVTEPSTVTFEEMLKEFKEVLGMSDEDSKKIGTTLDSLATKKEGSKFNLNKIKVQLLAAFLYKDMPVQSKEGDGKNTNPVVNDGNENVNKDEKNTSPVTEESTTEYAFAISLDMSEALPDLGFVKLNSLSIAVWNTEREAVLSQIGIGSIAKMLENLNANSSVAVQ